MNRRQLLLGPATARRTYPSIAFSVSSTLVLPLISEHELLGLITIDLRDVPSETDRAPDVPSEPDRAPDVRRFADRVATALKS